LRLAFGEETLKKKPVELNQWLNSLSTDKWQTAIPRNKQINGAEYKKIWQKLIGIE
jgi:hypothetical protein